MKSTTPSQQARGDHNTFVGDAAGQLLGKEHIGNLGLSVGCHICEGWMVDLGQRQPGERKRITRTGHNHKGWRGSARATQ